MLQLASDREQPLLERVRFAAIFAGNLDEFFMVRVAGLRRRIASGITVAGASGLTPREQLDLIARRVHEQVDRHAQLFRDELAPGLRNEGICLLRYDELSSERASSSTSCSSNASIPCSPRSRSTRPTHFLTSRACR